MKKFNQNNNINKFSLLAVKKIVRRDSDVNDINKIDNEKGSLYNNIPTKNIV